MGKNYDEVGVVRQLNKVNGVKISGSKKITIVVGAALGNSTNGKIDFLCNYCGYYHTQTSSEPDSTRHRLSCWLSLQR